MSHKTKFVLNDKEQAVLGAFRKIKKVGTNLVSLSDLAAAAFGKQKRGTSSKTKGNSWVRNSLRKPLRWGLVGHHGPRSGLYFRTDVELADLVKEAEAAAAEKVRKGTKKVKVARKKSSALSVSEAASGADLQA